MKLQLRSPDRMLCEYENITSFSATLLDGRRITILQDHAPLLAILQAGEVRVNTGYGEEVLPIESCLLKFRENEIILYSQAEIEKSGSNG